LSPADALIPFAGGGGPGSTAWFFIGMGMGGMVLAGYWFFQIKEHNEVTT
jgi:hypothetical protein